MACFSQPYMHEATLDSRTETHVDAPPLLLSNMSARMELQSRTMQLSAAAMPAGTALVAPPSPTTKPIMHMSKSSGELAADFLQSNNSLQNPAPRCAPGSAIIEKVAVCDLPPGEPTAATFAGAQHTPSLALDMAALERFQLVTAEQDAPDETFQGRVAIKALTDTIPFLVRDSSVPTTVYLRYKEAVSNQEAAEQIRSQKDEILRLKDHHAQQWAAHGRELVNDRHRRQKHTKSHQRILQRRNQNQVRAQVEAARTRDALREQQRGEHEYQMRKRVMESSATSSSLQVKRDEAQQAQQARQRQMCARERAASAQMLAQMREATLSNRKKMVSQARPQSDPALAAQVEAYELQQSCVQRVKEDEQQWKTERRRHNDEYLERARANKQRAMATRASAKQALADAFKSRKQAAAKERANDHLVAETKARLIESNRREVTAIYKKRFANVHEAEEWGSSALRRLNAAAAWLVSQAYTGTSGNSTRRLEVTL